jgi:hypothetical protein
MPSVTDQAFLVKLSDGNFLVDIDGRQITTTSYPGRANLVSYEVAAKMANYLRSRSYKNAHVTDVLGQPVDDQMLRAAVQAARVDAAPPLPATLEEFDQMRSSDVVKRYKNEPEFKQRVDELQKQKRQPRKQPVRWSDTEEKS